MVDNAIPVKKSSSPDWWMKGKGAGTENDPSAPFMARDADSYLGQDRTTTLGAAEELTIPANSKRAIISCGPNSQVYLNFNADASITSPLYFEDPFGPIIIDLGLVTKLSAWCITGNVGAVFFG